MVGPAGDTELSKSPHRFFMNHFLILNWNPARLFQSISGEENLRPSFFQVTFRPQKMKKMPARGLDDLI